MALRVGPPFGIGFLVKTPQPPALPEVTALLPEALAAHMPYRSGKASLTHGKAVWKWLRTQGIPSQWPESLPEAGHGALQALSKTVLLPDMKVDGSVQSRDGTIKWRILARGMPIETVLIPNPDRSTVCISSQSGCTRFCDFCATARMDFGGQLTAGEMVAQVMLARAHAPKEAPVTNVVFMGMGEPLDNADAVLQATQVMEHGLQLGPRHVTVSTSGVLPKMEEFVQHSRACVALSLHATTQELRDRLMPRVARWTIADLCHFMRQETLRSPRHFFIEYVLLHGVNDGVEDANRLAELMKDIRCRINLIPYNATDGQYVRPSGEAVRAFQARLVEHGLLCLTRDTRGEDAAAACGQLVYLGKRPAA